MKISSKDFEKVIDELLKDFSDFPFINREYINNILLKFQNKAFTFEGINVVVDLKENDNVYYYLLFQTKSILNQILCQKASCDEEILLGLMIKYGEKIKPYMQKLKIDINNPLYDQYFEEAIINFDNSKDLELHIVNYLKNRFNGKYVPIKSDKQIVFKGKSKISESKKETAKETPIKEVIEEEHYITIGEIDNSPNQKKKKLKVINTEEVTVKQSKPIDKYSYLFNALGLKNTLSNSENSEYNLYISLRYSEFYSLEDFEKTAKISRLSLYEYEKYTVEKIKEKLSRQLDREINLILN